MLAAPPKPSPQAILRLADVKVLHDRSYRLNLYLHPKETDLSSLSPEGRQAYFMRTITLWKTHHDDQVEIFVRPTPPELAHLGEGWVVTVQSEDAASDAAAGPQLDSTAARPGLPATSELIRGIELQER